MKKHIALCAVMIFAGLGVARANGIDPIALRQTVMDLHAADFAFIRATVTAKGDVKVLEGPAKAIARSTTLVPTLFPKGTETGGDTKALPEIWSDPAGFEKIATAASAAATKIAVAAKAGDADEVAAATKLLGEQCGACHRGYRAK